MQRPDLSLGVQKAGRVAGSDHQATGTPLGQRTPQGLTLGWDPAVTLLQQDHVICESIAVMINDDTFSVFNMRLFKFVSDLAKLISTFHVQ